MLKKMVLLVLTLALLLSSAAIAEASNRDMQLMGGVVVSNDNDSFFFAPTEEGVSKSWALYSVKTASEGPIAKIAEGFPARLIHADATNVYFLGYTNVDRTEHALYSVNISTGEPTELKLGIKDAFVGTDSKFLYVSTDEKYILCSYDLATNKDEKIKDMSASKKWMYDATLVGDRLFFLTKADGNESEDGYEYQYSSGKATNLDKPSPAVVNGMMYEDYRIYSADSTNSQIYAMKIGNKKSNRIGQSYNISLNSPRFGGNLYAYDTDNNAIVALPLDGSAEKKLTLESSLLTRFVVGGTKDEILLLGNDAIYSMPTDLSSQTKVMDFDNNTGAQMWMYVAPAEGANAIMVMGYGVETYTHAANMMPTGVYAFDRSTGEMLFGFPEYDPENPPEVTQPDVLGTVPQEVEEGETLFKWNE